MAAVVPFASCYGGVQLFGRGHRGALSLLAHRVPNYVPRPRLVCHAPRMTLRQICRMLKVMKKVKKREAAAASSAARKQGCASPTPTSPGIKSEKKCIMGCYRHKRKLKQVG